jgi:hypothetical protein
MNCLKGDEPTPDLAARIRELHKPFEIYEECGHEYEPEAILA